MQPVNKSPTSFSGGFVIGYDHPPQGVSQDEHRVPPEYALQKIDPAGHYRLAAAANESPNDYAVNLFRYSPQQARSSQIDALPNGG